MSAPVRLSGFSAKVILPPKQTVEPVEEQVFVSGLVRVFDPAKHPRVPAGSGDPSGEFTEASSGANVSVKADAVLAKVEDLSKTLSELGELPNWTANWIKSHTTEKAAIRRWQDGNVKGLVDRAGEILAGKDMVLSGEYGRKVDEIIEYGQAARLLKGAVNNKIQYDPLESAITLGHPILSKKQGDIIKLPLVSFTAAHLSKGDSAGTFSLDDYRVTVQSLIRFENPKFGLDLYKFSSSEKYASEREVIITGPAVIKSIKREIVTTSNGHKHEIDVVTLIRPDKLVE